MSETAPSAGLARWKSTTALFLGSQAVSLFGSSLVQYALLWHIIITTQRGSVVTVAIIVGFVPVLLLAPFAGVWADRHNRRYLIVAGDLLVAAATAGIIVAFMLGYRELWVIFLVMAIRAAGGGVQSPAIGALLPQIVPAKHLTQVNGYNSSIQAIVGLVSPFLAGALMSWADMVVIFFLDIVTAAIAVAILLIWVRVPPHAKAQERQDGSGLAELGYFGDLRAGLEYAWTHRYVRRILLYFGAAMILIAPAAFLSSLQVSTSFGNDVWRLSVLEVAFAAGMTIGGLIIAAWRGFSRPAVTIGVALLVEGLLVIGLGLAPGFGLYLVFMALIGVVVPAYNAPAVALMQSVVEESQMGRVLALQTMLATSVMPLSILIFGPLADITGVALIMLVCGAAEFVLGAVVLRDRRLAELQLPR